MYFRCFCCARHILAFFFYLQTSDLFVLRLFSLLYGYFSAFYGFTCLFTLHGWCLDARNHCGEDYGAQLLLLLFPSRRRSSGIDLHVRTLATAFFFLGRFPMIVFSFVIYCSGFCFLLDSVLLNHFLSN